MQRDLRRLADTPFDLVVIGAGIYGALAAWDAARRGLTVALVDRGDFGGATSFNSLKTLHGGLRSLQSFNLRQMRLFIRERRAMACMAPHLVDRLPFCVPTYLHPTRNAVVVRAALAIADAVAHDRHDGVVDPELHLPRGRIATRTECMRLNPLISGDGITGGAVWFDYQMRQPERLVVSAARSASDAGAVVANYVEALDARRAAGRLVALAVRDAVTGDHFDVRTRAVLNAAGPWAGGLLDRLTGGAAEPPAANLSRAMNLVVGRITDAHACGGVVNGRFLFVVPWRDVSILGTSHDPHDGDADAPHGTPAHVAQLLADARIAFPRATFVPSLVRLVHRGLLPMLSPRGGAVALLKESAVVDHARDGHRGVISIFSVRYTTARHTAAAAVEAVCASLGQPATVRGPAAARMTSAGFATLRHHVEDARRADMPGTTADLRERLARTYGTHQAEVAAILRATPDAARPLSPACAVTRAEVMHAVRHESALTLADVLLRRTAAGTAGHPGAAALAAAGQTMAAECGWSTDRLRSEMDAVAAVYPVP
jgi:glycerol-3-phosphate dehydrogenase